MPEGLILPKSRPQTDASGRMFIIFIDDLHLQVSDTPRVKELLKQIRDKLVHDNDLVGFVSTGTSTIEINPTYDFGHRRFNEAIDKMMGSGDDGQRDHRERARRRRSRGRIGLRHNAHVAFKTAYEMLDQLGQITDRRKSFIYVSSGYTFDPFRGRAVRRRSSSATRKSGHADRVDDEQGDDIEPADQLGYDVDTPLADQNYMQKTQFSSADLINELAQMTREAQRHNVIFYALDPRGLMADDDPDRCARPADLHRLARLHHDAEQLAADAVGRDRRVRDHARPTTIEGACSGSTLRPATTTSSATRRSIPDPFKIRRADQDRSDASGRRRTASTARTTRFRRRHGRSEAATSSCRAGLQAGRAQVPDRP